MIIVKMVGLGLGCSKFSGRNSYVRNINCENSKILLREPIHTPPNFNIDMAIVDKGVKVVVIHNVRWQDSHGDAHVSIVSRLHGGPEVEVFEITNHAAGTGGRNDTVEE